MYSEETVRSARLLDDGTLEIVREYSNTGIYFAVDPPQRVPNNIVKETYQAVEGKIVLTKTIEGKIVPEQRILARIEWQEEENASVE